MTLLTILLGRDSESFKLYELDLFVVFVLSLLVEWLSHTRFINSNTTNTVIAGLLQTGLYGIRITLAYLVMLSVMSLDIGVFLVAIAGYTAGFLVFGSRVFDKSDRKPSDLPPLNC